MNTTIIAGLVGFCAITQFSGHAQPPKPQVEYDEVVEMGWQCPDCTPEEKYVLKELQEQTRISDKNALSTILGNIKQESKFIANICEGGARVDYDQCYTGGYGIIQWTSLGRYNNLGKFSSKYGCSPSEFKCQVRYMINESVFQRNLPSFEGNGQTVSQYMRPAYYWLGWGIKGNRELYAYQYTKMLKWG